MNYVAIYYEESSGDTKAVLVRNRTANPHFIPEKLANLGVIGDETDVHAIIAVGDKVGVQAAESYGFLMVGCGYEDEQPIQSIEDE